VLTGLTGPRQAGERATFKQFAEAGNVHSDDLAGVVCHPSLARQVLTDLRGFDRTGLVYERVRTAMGNGLASTAHQDHRRQRLIMQPAFRHEHLSAWRVPETAYRSDEPVTWICRVLSHLSQLEAGESARCARFTHPTQ
jgi:cytochrome P450